MLKVDPRQAYALHGCQASRHIELVLQSTLPPHTLMQRAGLSLAKLALAIAPHARHIWIACGPGNNGGDGLEAAMQLQRWNKDPVVTWLGQPDTAPPEALASYQRAREAGVQFSSTPPETVDLGLDAMLGLGTKLRQPEGQLAHWINTMNASASTILAADLPTGLQGDTGQLSSTFVKASHTLSLLTLKPGLFTAHGRDAAGSVWFDDLGSGLEQAGPLPYPATAWLSGASPQKERAPSSHKGSYGDVAIVGGAVGMTGAALLAASAALHAGAGRVYVSLLDGGSLKVDLLQPELMFSPFELLNQISTTLVCGCGGGLAVGDLLPQVLSTPAPLVLDADALNAIARDSALEGQLVARGTSDCQTVMTPHPLEAARLLGLTTIQVQNDRLQAATQLAQRFRCTVVLKGSGTVIAAPGRTPVINDTGNARLATAGTGDVLAGLVGAKLANGDHAFEAACKACYQHGALADHWPVKHAITASALAKALRA
jgi:hydroxyethylthiazole kinase-like uncharacterized protein yjeF